LEVEVSRSDLGLVGQSNRSRVEFGWSVLEVEGRVGHLVLEIGVLLSVIGVEVGCRSVGHFKRLIGYIMKGWSVGRRILDSKMDQLTSTLYH
jgi:hypothetical protein